MTRHIYFSRIILLALLMCLLLGLGVGWVLAERPETQGSPSLSQGEAQERLKGSGAQFYKRVTGFSFRPVHYATTYVGVNGVCLYRSDDSGYGTFKGTAQIWAESYSKQAQSDISNPYHQR